MGAFIYLGSIFYIFLKKGFLHAQIYREMNILQKSWANTVVCLGIFSVYQCRFIIIISSIFCVQIVLNLSNLHLASKAMSITIGAIIHAFFSCWNGQLLIDESINLDKSL